VPLFDVFLLVKHRENAKLGKNFDAGIIRGANARITNARGGLRLGASLQLSPQRPYVKAQGKKFFDERAAVYVGPETGNAVSDEGVVSPFCTRAIRSGQDSCGRPKTGRGARRFAVRNVVESESNG
jgi:hypothetical protein